MPLVVRKGRPEDVIPDLAAETGAEIVSFNRLATPFAAWTEGRTGYPVVDAAMRELDATGWIHNRARMVAASFLTKDLMIDWRLGERVFFDRLVDADPASNSGGWQWAASTGTDAQRTVRIFNPVLQGERFDPKGVWVRRWVPELRSVQDARVHRPWLCPDLFPTYPAPIVDHASRRDEAERRFAVTLEPAPAEDPPRARAAGRRERQG